MYFEALDTPATLRRLSAYSGNKASRASVGTVYGMLQPIDQDANTIALRMVGQAYRFDVNVDTDIQVRDELTIDSETYTVRGIQPFARLSIDIKACFLEKNK